MVHGNNALLYIHTCTHIFCTTNENTHTTIIHLGKQLLTFLIGVCLMNIGNFLTRYTIVIYKTIDNIGIGIVFLSLTRYACITEDELRAFLFCKLVINLLDILTDSRYLSSLCLPTFVYQTRIDSSFCGKSAGKQSPRSIIVTGDIKVTAIFTLHHVHYLTINFLHEFCLWDGNDMTAHLRFRQLEVQVVTYIGNLRIHLSQLWNIGQ